MGNQTKLIPASRRNIEIREATSSDVAAIAEIHVLGWQEAYAGLLPQNVLDQQSKAERQGQWRGVVARDDGSHWTLVAVDGDKTIVGFVHALRLRRSKVAAPARIVALYVRSEHQRNGIGKALTENVAQAMAAAGIGEVRLWCLWNNIVTRRFYERLGGRITSALVETMRGTRVMLVGYAWNSASDLAQ